MLNAKDSPTATVPVANPGGQAALLTHDPLGEKT